MIEGIAYVGAGILAGNALSFLSSMDAGAMLSLFCDDVLDLKSSDKLVAGLGTGFYSALKIAEGSQVEYIILVSPGSYCGLRVGFSLGRYLDERLGVTERRREMLKRYIKE